MKHAAIQGIAAPVLFPMALYQDGYIFLSNVC